MQTMHALVWYNIQTSLPIHVVRHICTTAYTYIYSRYFVLALIQPAVNLRLGQQPRQTRDASVRRQRPK